MLKSQQRASSRQRCMQTCHMQASQPERHLLSTSEAAQAGGHLVHRSTGTVDAVVKLLPLRGQAVCLAPQVLQPVMPRHIETRQAKKVVIFVETTHGRVSMSILVLKQWH